MLLLASMRLPLAVAAPTCDFNLFPGTSCTNKAFQQDSHPAGSRRLLRLRLLLPQVGQHDEQRRLLRAMRRRARLQLRQLRHRPLLESLLPGPEF